VSASPLDVVMGGDAARGSSSGPSLRSSRSLAVWVAWLIALALHGVLILAALRSGPSLEAWSASLALEVHEALVDDQVIELATPEVPTPEPTLEDTARPTSASPSRAHAPRAAAAAEPVSPTSPTQAASVVTQDAPPIDLTGETIVTGSGTAVGGGVSSAQGNAESATQPTQVTQGSAPSPPRTTQSPTLTRAVRLEASAWSCDWPREAVAEDIYEQAVVLRVVVRADGHVEAAQLVDDPGHGFGRAALACAKRTVFTPALDKQGEPTRALSPPIRVRFTR